MDPLTCKNFYRVCCCLAEEFSGEDIYYRKNISRSINIHLTNLNEHLHLLADHGLIKFQAMGRMSPVEVVDKDFFKQVKVFVGLLRSRGLID